MPEIARLIGGSDILELDFVEREATPAMNLDMDAENGVLGDLSDYFSAKRSRRT
jgi:hypothetical protein